MRLTITDVGIAAATSAGLGGPHVNLTTFKVGAAVGYTPLVTDTALRGTILHTGNIANYYVESPDTVVYRCIIDESYGDFSFGEIGLYDSGGNLFALGALDAVQIKRKVSGVAPGNVIDINVKLQLTQLAAVIDFTILQLTNAKLLEIASIELLNPPVVSLSNAYLAHSNDDGNNPPLCLRDNDWQWKFDTHQYPLVTNGVVIAGAGNTVTGLESLSLPSLEVQAGRFIVQFITGALKGIPRFVSSYTPAGGGAQARITWATPLGSAPVAGDRFVILQSNFSLLDTIKSLPDNTIGLIMALGASQSV